MTVSAPDDTPVQRAARLAGGWYNSDDRTAANPGGLGDDGHVDNLPALLVDVGKVAQAVGVDAEAVSAAAASVAGSVEAATTAAGAAVVAKGDAEAAATVAVNAAASVSLPAPAAGDTGKWLQWSGATWELGVIAAATTAAAGLVRLATTAEVQTGTATTCAVTPAAGRAAYVGQGLHTIWVPAATLFPRVTAGCGVSSVETAMNKVMRPTCDFDAATQEHAQCAVAMPKSWDRGPVSFQALWTAAGGSGGVVFGLQNMALSDGDALDAAFGSAVTVTDTLGAAGALHITPTSGAVPILFAGSATADDMVFFQVFRAVADPADTLAQDAQLLGLRLFYTVNAATDA